MADRAARERSRRVPGREDRRRWSGETRALEVLPIPSACGWRRRRLDKGVERDVQAIFQELDLADTEDDNRRVLAVLAPLGH
jgi:hypothetical protein